MLDAVTDAELRKRLSGIQDRIRNGLSRVDPHQRLQGRPVTHRVISGQTFEITFAEVPKIDEAEVLGVKKLIGEPCFCCVSPATAETLTVSFVVPLK
jgi:hypothetical protein